MHTNLTTNRSKSCVLASPNEIRTTDQSKNLFSAKKRGNGQPTAWSPPPNGKAIAILEWPYQTRRPQDLPNRKQRQDHGCKTKSLSLDLTFKRRYNSPLPSPCLVTNDASPRPEIQKRLRPIGERSPPRVSANQREVRNQNLASFGICYYPRTTSGISNWELFCSTPATLPAPIFQFEPLISTNIQTELYAS